MSLVSNSLKSTSEKVNNPLHTFPTINNNSSKNKFTKLSMIKSFTNSINKNSKTNSSYIMNIFKSKNIIKENNSTRYSMHLIRRICKMLEIPQIGISTSQVFFHKCLSRLNDKSKYLNKEFFLTMACVFVGSKAEESIRDYRDLIMAFDRVWDKQMQINNNTETSVIYHNQEERRYHRWKKYLFYYEHSVLHMLGHILNYEHPYKFLLSYLNALHMDDVPTVYIQRAWNYINDSIYSPNYINYTPEVIACSAIYLTSLELHYPLPTEPQPWYNYNDLRILRMLVFNCYLATILYDIIVNNLHIMKELILVLNFEFAFDVEFIEMKNCCNDILENYFMETPKFYDNDVIMSYGTAMIEKQKNNINGNVTKSNFDKRDKNKRKEDNYTRYKNNSNRKKINFDNSDMDTDTSKSKSTYDSSPTLKRKILNKNRKRVTPKKTNRKKFDIYDKSFYRRKSSRFYDEEYDKKNHIKESISKLNKTLSKKDNNEYYIQVAKKKKVSSDRFRGITEIENDNSESDGRMRIYTNKEKGKSYKKYNYSNVDDDNKNLSDIKRRRYVRFSENSKSSQKRSIDNSNLERRIRIQKEKLNESRLRKNGGNVGYMGTYSRRD